MVERLRKRTSFKREGFSPNKRWTLEILAGAIYSLKEAGEPINPGYLDKSHERLYSAIRDMPGGWDRVVSEAGFDPDKEVFGARRISLVNRNASVGQS